MDTPFDPVQLLNVFKESLKPQPQKTFEQFITDLKITKEQQLPDVAWSDFVLLYKLHAEEKSKQMDPTFFDGLSKFFSTLKPANPSNEWPPPGFPKEPE